MSKNENTTTPNSGSSFDEIFNARSLEELNDTLTQAMVSKKIHTLIKGDNLNMIVDAVMNFAQNQDDKQKLLASAVLARLANVAKKRGSDVLKKIPRLIIEEPPSLDILSDEQLTNTAKDSDLGKIKYYVAQSLRIIDDSWVPDYCLREAVNMDTAEKARDELLNIALEKYGNSAEWMKAIAAQATVLNFITNPETKLKRVRRLFAAILKQLRQWQGELGDDPGYALEKLFAGFIRDQSYDVEEKLLFDTIDCGMAMLLRFIELRFSIAFHAKTYAVIGKSKRTIGPGKWSNFLRKSDEIGSLRICLLEAALVLARQRQTDSQIMAVMISVYTSRPQTCSAIERHFKSALDLDPECYNWWRHAGSPPVSRRQVEHKFHNTEDEHIGSLLIEVESSREAMQKLERTVAPLLEISDPGLSSTVKKTARSYLQIVQILHRLAKMRNLDTTSSKGKVMQYNQSEHEMLGGHQAGVRRVKVIRDGITKEFGGRQKTLVKAWVEPAD